MKIDTNKLNVSKKHLIAIAVIVATGVVLGSAILGGKATKTAEDDGHGHGSHVEAKAHSDGEHHGKESGDKHDHDKGHADGEHHEAPTKGPHGGKLFKEGDFGLEAFNALFDYTDTRAFMAEGYPLFKAVMQDPAKALTPLLPDCQSWRSFASQGQRVMRRCVRGV